MQLPIPSYRHTVPCPAHRNQDPPVPSPKNRSAVLFFILLLAVITAAPPLSAQDRYFVQSDRADVLSRPALGSPVVIRLSKGDGLTSAGRRGAWIQVRNGSRDGFVPVLLLASHPPMDELQVAAEQRPAQKYNFRRRSSPYAEHIQKERRPSGRQDASGEKPKTDYKALKTLESMTVGMDSIVEFMGKP